MTFTFTATSPFAIKIEDFSGSAHAFAYSAGRGASAYFANLELYSGAVTLPDAMSGTNVPKTATIGLSGVAPAALTSQRRRR